MFLVIHKCYDYIVRIQTGKFLKINDWNNEHQNIEITIIGIQYSISNSFQRIVYLFFKILRNMFFEHSAVLFFTQYLKVKFLIVFLHFLSEAHYGSTQNYEEIETLMIFLIEKLFIDILNAF